MVKRLSRSEVPVEQTWDVAHIFSDQDAWTAAYDEVEKEIPTVTAYKGRLGEGPKTFLDCLESFESLMLKFMRVATYASLNQSSDGTNTDYQVAMGRVGSLAAKLQSET